MPSRRKIVHPTRMAIRKKWNMDACPSVCGKYSERCSILRQRKTWRNFCARQARSLTMLATHANRCIPRSTATGVDQVISENGGVQLISIFTPKQVGEECFELMRRCHDALSPESICESYNQTRGGNFKSPTNRPEVLDAMWHDLGTETCTCIADGIRVLASIWESAFQSASETAAFARVIDQSKLQTLYEKKEFLASRYLEQFTPADLPVPARREAGGR